MYIMKKQVERTPTIHKKELVVNRQKLKIILDSKGMEFIQLHKRIEERYGLDLKYKGFMSLLANRSTWKLLYAHAIAEELSIDYKDIFEMVDVDVNKVKKEKEEWKAKYEKRKKK